MKKIALALFKRYPALKKIYLNYIHLGYNSKNRLPWKRLCHSRVRLNPATRVSERNRKVLMATCAGGLLTALDMESLLSVALTLRGAEVHALLCDRFLPACIMCQAEIVASMKRFAARGPSRLFCKRCFESGADAYRTAGLRIHLFSEYITPQEAQEVDHMVDHVPGEAIKDYTYQDLAVGEHALAGALRFFARGSIDEEKYALPVLKRYFKASLLTAIALQKVQHEQEFDAAVFHHGIYVPQGVIGEVCRKEAVRVVNWNVGYRQGTFIYSHNDTYHHTMMVEPVSNWEAVAWSAELERSVMTYIQNRSKGTRDWHVFLNEPSGDISALGIDPSKPAIGLLTNVCWDAQLHYPANIFENMLQWIFETIEYFTKRPDLQLIIRVHPAEVTAELPSRQLVVGEIQNKIGSLPPNIFVVAPESRLNTYTLMEACNAVIIYGTKTGVELTSLGIPVIVAGEAWIRNKGITIDPESKADYFAVLDRLPLSTRLSEALVQRARQYAYHFFFRRMIPVEVIQPSKNAYSFSIRLSALEDLAPGRNAGLDVICNGILSGQEFIYEYEKYVPLRSSKGCGAYTL
jgi:hypothetical protein